MFVIYSLICQCHRFGFKSVSSLEIVFIAYAKFTKVVFTACAKVTTVVVMA